MSYSRTKLKFLSAIGAFAAVAVTQISFAADEPALAPSEPVKLEKVEVTGSRILRNQVEGPAPVTIITAEQIERQGFTTVADVLNSLALVNSVAQNEQSTNSFTPNLNTVDLRGLGPGYTLVLVNGRRQPDYPGAYNSESNAVNVGAIPTVALDRIEVVSGGASAIYGSDAVAGVINIILKKNFEGYYASATYGDTAEGGGESKRLQFFGGNSLFGGRLNAVYGAEYLDREPIYAFQRRRTDSSLDAPTVSGRAPSRNYVIFDEFGATDSAYIDPGADACANFAATGLQYNFRDPQGFYCGSNSWNSLTSFRNKEENYSGYANLSFKLTDAVEAYGFASYWHSDSTTKFSAPYWFSGSRLGFVVDATRPAPSPDFDGVGGTIVGFQRLFTVEETGSLDDLATGFKEETYEIGGGIKGFIFGDFQYDARVSSARYDADTASRYFVFDLVEDYFLGQPLGEAGGFLEGSGIQIYNPNYDNLNNPLTPETYRSLTDVSRDANSSGLDVANAQLTGTLFTLPAGPVEFASLVEFARQKYELAIDPRLRPDQATFFGVGGTGGKGDRDRYAAAVEVRVPIIETLMSTLAVRYDKYNDITKVDDAVTYNAGLEFRPLKSMLLRGTYATSFRAPDMHYIFAGDSSFFQTVTDYYKCRKYEPEEELSACSYAEENISGERAGNPDLEEEEGKSFTGGIVWDVFDNLSLSADYYDIELKNVVGDQSTDALLITEADCRFGETEEGEPVDINSGECQNALSALSRLPDNGTENGESLLSVSVGPINRAILRTSGVDVGAKYFLKTRDYGRFDFRVDWSHVLTFDFAEFAGDPIEDIRDEVSPNNDLVPFRSRLNGSVSWDIDQWRLTLYGSRSGTIPSQFGTNRLPPYIVYNASVGYEVNKMITLTLIGNNIFNKLPPRDSEETVFPYFDIYHYSITGRELFGKVEVKF